MILVTGHVRFPPEAVAALRPHMKAVVEATRKEDGCLLYAFGEDVIEPGLIRIVERWRDFAALEAHGSTAHIAAWSKVAREAGVLSREVIAHAAGEERIL